MDAFILWLAQGGGLGRLKPAPGTWGSLGGLLLTFLLLASGSAWLYGAGCLAGIGISVWACGEAERILGQRDPGSVVLDEIIALPICFVSWMTLQTIRFDRLPGPGELLTGPGLLTLFGVFAAFRFFDIVKPWPVAQSQSLPGGWGVTLDDVLAAGYVNLVVLLIAWVS